ncbi:hypothetical protein EB796_009922 [Bugula neritina]|uniref:Uncharacterized protein n=1 Tax=Bugula neritina TaxID=10212 RepID=A0A7J7K0R2_BUGNE|nr:hypothetical protein EB796_009922 [Bugula neritina]
MAASSHLSNSDTAAATHCPAAWSHDLLPAASSHDQLPAASSHDQLPAALSHDQLPAASSHDQLPAASSHDQVVSEDGPAESDGEFPDDDVLVELRRKRDLLLSKLKEISRKGS